MSCPNCGAQLEVSNQRFCQDCGKKLQEPSKNSELAQKSLTPPEYRENHHLHQKPVKIPTSRPLSKRSLGFGIVSLIIAAITFNAGSSMLTPPFLLPLSGRIILFMSFGILNIVGIGFGIISRVFNAQAKRRELKNTAMKVGSTLGSIGLIFNLVLMIAIFILVGILMV
ncbi:MAG: zinc ribbon domain-containing protein [Candidatus Lokiarchaeota archaeon]|nr:zinc ribbon domain-containing protein [Candidatus Lokiarchaeota archaeon]